MKNKVIKEIPEVIRDIMSDEDLFEIGYSGTFKQINIIVLSTISQLYPEFSDIPKETISHHLSKLLEVYNNHRDNKYYDDYIGTCTRDISKVKISSNRAKYTFGMPVS